MFKAGGRHNEHYFREPRGINKDLMKACEDAIPDVQEEDDEETQALLQHERLLAY
jgi:hypothetical protein